MALSFIISETKRHTGRSFHILLHSTPPLRGPRRIIAIPFGVEKLEWSGISGYPTVK